MDEFSESSSLGRATSALQVAKTHTERTKWDHYYTSLPLIDEDPISRAFSDEFAARIAALLPDGARTLEAGCGAGWQSLALARSGKFEVNLLDFSREALAYARKVYENAGVPAHFVEGDVFSLDSPSYDLVFNSGVLEHYNFDEQVAFLRGMASRSRNYVLVLVPNRLCYWYWLWRMQKIGAGSWPFGKEVPLADFSGACEAAGLHYIGQAFMGASWTESFISGIPGLDEETKHSILAIHRSAMEIPLAQKSYLVAFLASVRSVTDVAGWEKGPLVERLQAAEMNALLADALALRIAAENDLTLNQEKAAERERMLLAEQKEMSDHLKEEQRVALVEIRDRFRAEMDEQEEALLEENDHLATRAGLREQSLITERDQYVRQLNQLYSTKAWRISAAVWAARRKGILAPFYLAFTLAKYALRVGYHLTVPFSLRRDLWYRRHTGVSYRVKIASEQEQRSKVAARHVAHQDAMVNARANSSVMIEAVGPDVICFPVIDWDFRFQRPQQLLSQFARMGHRCYYLNTHFIGFDQFTVRSREIGTRLKELFLPGDSDVVIYHDRLRRATLRRALRTLTSFCRQEDITDAVCIVQHPFWEPLAAALKKTYGWKIVYDCMDDHQGFGNNSEEVLAQESQLFTTSDLLVATSRVLYDKISPHHNNCVLVPNAGDYDHFATIPPRESSPIAHLRGPVIGYYGAIAEWFDGEAVAVAARQHPEWSFVLIGHTFGADLSGLETLPNVHLLGEKPYEALPSYVAGFDICTIPFQRIPLTEATNPVKVFEYLATGKPVVARNLPELEPYANVVSLYEQPDDFVQKLESAMGDTTPDAQARRRESAKHNTWAIRCESLLKHINSLYCQASIVIVTFHNTARTVLTLKSVLEKTRYPKYNIIVVDNGGHEDLRNVLTLVAEQHPTKVTTVFNSDNFGFAAANNIGIAQASGSDYVVLLNDDVIVTPGWLGRLIWHLRDKDIGMIGPVTNSCGNEACINVDYTNLSDIDAFARRYCSEHEGQLFDIEALAMYCVALRREVVDNIGPLDETFGVGMFEDDDYAVRLRKAGYRVVCAEDVFLHHFGRSSFSKMEDEEYFKLFETNRVIFEQKWGIVWQVHKYRDSLQPSEWH